MGYSISGKKRPRTDSVGWRVARKHRGAGRLRVALLSSNAVLGEYVMRALHALGAKIFLIYDKQLAASLRLSRRCQAALLGSENLAAEQPARILEIINRFHAEESEIDVIMASDIVGLLLLATIRHQLSAPVYPMAEGETLLQLSDKWKFHNLCTANSVTVPKSAFFASKNEIEPPAVEEVFGFPVMVKPVAMYGGIGIQFIGSQADLVERVLHNAAYGYSGLLVQKYVPGRDWGLSVFARSGRIECWTTFACDEHWGTEFAEQVELLEFGKRLVAATGFEGVANFDARLDPRTGRIHLLECNPRFFVRATATRLCGLDFVRAGLAAIGLTQPGHSAGCEGKFYSAGRLLSRQGFGRLLRGQWPLRPLLGNLAEILADPLPVAARRWGVNSEP
jgi:biotin carboxylase